MIKIPPRRVLVAVDMSEESMLAWEHAVSLRRHFGCAIEAAFIVTKAPALRWDKLPGTPRLARAKLKAALLERVGAGEKVVLAYGEPVMSLRRLARTRRADLIVIGPHRHSPVDRLLNGSVTETLIRESPIPVLAVHGRPRQIVRVLAPVSSKPYSEAGFFAAAAAAGAFDANLVALRVDGNPGHLDLLARKLPEEVRVTTMTRFGRVEDEILDAAQGCQLIVMAAHRKSLLDDLRHNMTAVKVLRHADVPVLVLPETSGRFLAPVWKNETIARTT